MAERFVYRCRSKLLLNHAHPGMIWGGLSYQAIDGYTNIHLFESQGSTHFAFWLSGASRGVRYLVLDACSLSIDNSIAGRIG